MNLTVNNYSKVNYNKQSFRGSIDKSLLNYLKEVKSDVIKAKGASVFGKDVTPRPENVVAAKNLISEVLPKLHEFMAKTHPNTKLVLKSNYAGKIRELYFKNTKLGAEIRGYNPYAGVIGSGEVTPSGVGLKKPENIKERSFDDLFFYTVTLPHGIAGLKDLSEWTNSLVSYINPKKIDNAIFNKMIKGMEKDAEKLSWYGKFKTKKNVKKANTYAEEFGEKPVYKEKFEKIAREKQLAKEQDLRQQIPIKEKLEELKNLEIK